VINKIAKCAFIRIFDISTTTKTNKVMKTQNYKVGYTKNVGGQGETIVKAQNQKDALNNAKFNRHTGKDFFIMEVTEEKANASNNAQAQ